MVALMYTPRGGCIIQLGSCQLVTLFQLSKESADQFLVSQTSYCLKYFVEYTMIDIEYYKGNGFLLYNTAKLPYKIVLNKIEVRIWI